MATTAFEVHGTLSTTPPDKSTSNKAETLDEPLSVLMSTRDVAFVREDQGEAEHSQKRANSSKQLQSSMACGLLRHHLKG